MSAESANKRRRPDSPAGLEHQEEFWYKDGSIILVAENSAFRVHQSILSKWSPVFADLFNLAQPSDAEIENIDGCPIVHLSDSQIDISILLDAIYDGKKWFGPKPKVPFAALDSLIRMAHKYQIKDILEEGITQLKRRFPHRFNAWNESINNVDFWARLKTDCTGVAIAAIHLARLVDIPEIIPVALFECCQYPDKYLVEGVRNAHGTLLKLSSEDLIQCLEFRSKIMRKFWLMWEKSILRRPTICESYQYCNHRIATIFQACVLTHIVNTSDIFATTRSETLFLPNRPCSACMASLVAKDSEIRRRMWDAIPTLFSVTVNGWNAN